MAESIQFLRKILSLKYAGLFILLVCITAKSVLICYYSYIGRDKMYHLSATYNLLHGKGWTNSIYYADEPDKEVKEAFCLWPPGYGLLLAPVQYILDDDLHRTIDVVEIISFIAFLLLCRGLLSSQGMSRPWLNISTILLSFFPHEFIEVSLGTDLPGLCFMLGYFYATVLLWSSDRKQRALMIGSVAALCLFLAGFTRYMYVPVAVFIAILMIALAWWKGKQMALPGYWLCLLLSSALLAGAAIYQGASCADPFYIGTDKKSLFIDNLAYWHPAALAAFINPEVYATVLERLTGIGFLSWKMIFNWINLVVYVFLIAVAIRYAKLVWQVPGKDLPVFRIVGFLLSVAIIGELAALSLTNSPKYTLSGVAWTFIMEGRYQAFAIVFLQLFFLLEIFRAKGWRRLNNLRAFAMASLFLLLCLNAMQQAAFTFKVAVNFRGMKEKIIREQDYDFAEAYMRQVIQDNPGTDVFVASSDAYYPFMASVLGAKGIKDYRNAGQVADKVRRPSVLIAVVMEPEANLYHSFTGRNGVRLVKAINGTYIYRQDIASFQEK